MFSTVASRERQAWFICEDPEFGFTAQRLRDWMGDFTKEKSIAKHCGWFFRQLTTTNLANPTDSLLRNLSLQLESARFVSSLSRLSGRSLTWSSNYPMQSFSTTREVKGKLSITREPDIKNEKLCVPSGKSCSPTSEQTLTRCALALFFQPLHRRRRTGLPGPDVKGCYRPPRREGAFL